MSIDLPSDEHESPFKATEPFRLSRAFVALCEGDADRNFLRKLIESRNLPPFDIPYTGGAGQDYNGNGAFGKMLQGLRGDMVSFSQVKGILIVADSGSSPAKMFTGICSQVRSVGLPVPDSPSQPAFSAGFPAIAITLLPSDDIPGALESLYVEDIQSRNLGVDSCVENFLRCGPITAHAWPIEKLVKARYECMVAALNRDDPSRSVTYALRGNRPVVDIKSQVFNDIANRVRVFCDSIAANHS